MPRSNSSSLGELEREVLKLVWQGSPASADYIRAKLTRPLRESTVRTVLRRLEEKGHLTHTVEGRTFLYSGAEAPRHAAAKAVKRIADWFCNGSIEDVVAGLVEADMLDRRELQRLSENIAKAKKGKRS
jgi:BlaI family penicillinase repressor